MSKWMINPPCEAELYLEDLFAAGKIEPGDSAPKVQKEHEIFKPYSTAVFRNNFKRHREWSGLGLSMKLKLIFQIKIN